MFVSTAQNTTTLSPRKFRDCIVDVGSGKLLSSLKAMVSPSFDGYAFLIFCIVCV